MRPGIRLSERYTLGDELGTGDNGSVWTGHDTVIDRPVTIKILAAELAADEATRERFRHIALSVAELAVPGIVDVHDCLEEPDPDGGLLVCQVTERVAGRSLRDLLAERGSLPPAEALRLVAEVATALDAAHRAGVHHGAVKPENLIVADDGAVTVVDFGFGRPKPSPYTGPERGVDVAADVYGLGAVGYECLTGEPPSGDGDIAPLLAELDPADAAPIMKALAPQPNRRFASAAGFADACRGLAPTATDADDTDDAAEESPVDDAVVAAPPAGAEPSEPSDSAATVEAAEAEVDEADAATPAEPDDEAAVETDPAADHTETPAQAAEDDADDAPVAATDADDDDDPPASPTRTRILVVGAVLAVMSAIAVLLYTALPGPPTGQHRPEPTTATSSQSPSKSPSASPTEAGQSPNSADPAPTTGSPTPSDDPTTGDNDDEVQVPFVVGKRVETAQAELSGLGFLVIVSEEGQGRQQCRVHNQNPNAGTTAPHGSTVTISVRRVNNPQQCIDPT